MGQLVERPRLMRILAIAEDRLAAERQGDPLREVHARLDVQVPGDRRIVGAGRAKRGPRQVCAGLLSNHAAAGLHLRDDTVVLIRAGQHSDVPVVLGSRADHRRAADV